MRVRALIVALLMFGMMGPTAAATINLYAAGSLQNALTDVAKTYQSAA
jgi:ABC-type molybdate transport system substrate-binding protein